MSEGSNRIIVRVECIHDELFELTGYHPAGTEHVSVYCLHTTVCSARVMQCVCVHVCYMTTGVGYNI